MKQLNFVKDAALAFAGTFVSDHNRSPLSISFERIESSVRTQNGTMRKYFRADKRSISVSWSNLPEDDTETVDAGMGADDLETFYLNNTGAFTVTITYDTGVTEDLTMVFTDFDKSLESRKPGGNLYDVSLSLEEV